MAELNRWNTQYPADFLQGFGAARQLPSTNGRPSNNQALVEARESAKDDPGALSFCESCVAKETRLKGQRHSDTLRVMIQVE